MTDWVSLLDGLDFPEGPTFDIDGNLYVVEEGAGVITQFDLQGERSVLAEVGGGPNGLVLGLDGALYVANNGRLDWGPTRQRSGPPEQGRIEKVSLGGDVDVVCTGAGARPLLGPNDIVIDGSGDLWFTDPGNASSPGFVVHASPDGSSARDVAGSDGEYLFPNGLAFRPGGDELVVAEMGSGYLWLHDVHPDGGLGHKREFARLPRGHRPDGMAIDAEGNIVVAGAFGGTILVYSADGVLVDSIPMEDPMVTNVAFAPGVAHMVVTLSGRGEVVRTTWPCGGLDLPGLAAMRAGRAVSG